MTIGALLFSYGWHFLYVCRSVSPHRALPALCFVRIIIIVQSLFARGWWTRRDGVFFCIRLKKSPQLPLVGSIFSGECRTPLFLPSCKCVNERTNFKQRLYALKKYRLMTHCILRESEILAKKRKALKIRWFQCFAAICHFVLWPRRGWDISL